MLSIFSCACWASVYLLWRNVYSGLFPIFQLSCFFILLLSCIGCLYVLEIKPLSVASVETIFSHSVGCLFFFYGFLCCACQFDYVPLYILERLFFVHVKRLFFKFLWLHPLHVEVPGPGTSCFCCHSPSNTISKPHL